MGLTRIGYLRTSAALAVAVLLASLAVVVPSADAAVMVFNVTKTVDESGSCDPGDCSLREAIDAANANPGSDTINVPAGHYTTTIPGAVEFDNATGSFDVKESVTIVGAGSGTDAGSTIIDAAGDNRVFTFTSTSGGDLQLEGMRLTGGYAAIDDGCALFSYASLTLTDVVVTGNNCPQLPVWVMDLVGSPSPAVSFNQVQVVDNTPSGSGGGPSRADGLGSGNGGVGVTKEDPAEDGATVNLTDTIIEGNVAGSGGFSGLDLDAAQVTLIRVEVNDNTASTSGVRLVVPVGSITIDDLSVVGNHGSEVDSGGLSIHGAGSTTALDANGVTVTGGTTGFHGLLLDKVGTGTIAGLEIAGSPAGSGVRAQDSTQITVSDFHIHDNVGTMGGGVFAYGGGPRVHLTNGVIEGNMASDYGGGALIETVSTGRLALANVQVLDNVGSSGGGVVAGYNSRLNLFQSTVVGNTAMHYGGGVLPRDPAVQGDVADNGYVEIYGSIIAGNSATTSGDQCFLGPLVSHGSNLESTDTCGLGATGDLVDTDPMLGEVSMNGWDVQYPLPGSPARDADAAGGGSDCGNDAVAYTALVKLDGGHDMFDVVRPQVSTSGPGATTACDIGSIEAVPSEITITATDGAEGGADGSFVLSRAGSLAGPLDVSLTYSGTAAAADYTGTLPATATFADGDDEVVIPIDVVDDEIEEATETVIATITGAQGTGAGLKATSSIADDDGPATVDESAAGKDRFETAAVLSEQAFPSGAPVAILARSDVYADALAAGPLAAQLGGPVLLTRTTSLPDATLAELRRLKVTTIIVAGGKGAVSDAVVVQLDAEFATVRRVAGENRFETAAKIGAELLDGGVSATPGRAYVTEGINASPTRGWPDALSVAPVAAGVGAPILLVSKTSAPAATLQAIKDLGITEAIVIGGSGAVSDEVLASLKTAAGSASRIFGSDRYSTSLKVAEHGLTVGASAESTWFATGTSFADALVAGPVVALEGGSMLLVNGKSADSFAATPAAAWLNDADKITDVHFIGGVGAIIQAVRDKIIALVS